MATLLERPTMEVAEGRRDAADQALEKFLAELGDLSRRYGVGIGDGAFLYLLEPEDFARSYTASDESALSFN